MSEKIKSKLEIDVFGRVYEFGGGGQPEADSVGSEEIKDGSVQPEDLDAGIQEKLDVLDEGNVITEGEIDEDWEAQKRQAGIDF